MVGGGLIVSPTNENQVWSPAYREMVARKLLGCLLQICRFTFCVRVADPAGDFAGPDPTLSLKKTGAA